MKATKSPCVHVRSAFPARRHIQIWLIKAIELARRDDGNTMVETALSLVLLMTTMMLVIALSEATYAKHFVASAARQGTRYAMVRGATFAGTACSANSFSCQASSTDITNYVLTFVPPGLSVSATSVAVRWPGLAASGKACLTLSGTNSPGCSVQVTVSYNFFYNLPLIPSASSTFVSSSTMMITQ